MYSACLYCQGNLGRNELLPRFPVGRRLAFDVAKGRLWVICGTLRAMEPLAARRTAGSRSTNVSASSVARAFASRPTNIGLVELRDGVTLIRIGKPLCPEFAAWRYGRRFSRRRRARRGLAAGTVITGCARRHARCGRGRVSADSAFVTAYATAFWLVRRRPQARARSPPSGSTDVCSASRRMTPRRRGSSTTADGGSTDSPFHHTKGVELLRGPDVRRVLGHVIPTLSPFGGAGEESHDAIELVDHAGSADECITTREAAATRLRWIPRRNSRSRADLPSRCRCRRRANDARWMASWLRSNRRGVRPSRSRRSRTAC